MIDRAMSERLMLAKEAMYIKDLKEIPGINTEVLAALSSLYRSGWRDCWEAELMAEMDRELGIQQETD